MRHGASALSIEGKGVRNGARNAISIAAGEYESKIRSDARHKKELENENTIERTCCNHRGFLRNWRRLCRSPGASRVRLASGCAEPGTHGRSREKTCR